MQDEIFDYIRGEEKRQREGLELIPSENYVSRAVLEAVGSVLTNKYSEGFPGRRYYGGQEWTDKVEQVAIDRAKKLFNADHANVQPHSGANANEAVYNAWLEPGDTVLGMRLEHGGHLTHGAPVTRSANIYRFVRYGVTDFESGDIDYDELEKVAIAEQPKIVLVGYSAYPRIPDFARIQQIAEKVGAVLMADMAHVAGLIAGGAHPNPFDYGFHVITTTTHKTLRGTRGGLILSKGTPGNPLKRPEKTVDNLPTLIDRSVFPGTQGGPLMHVIAAKAIGFGENLQPEFKDYAVRVVKNAKALAYEMKERGYKMMSGGTENHLLLIDMLGSKGVNGADAEKAMDKVGLTANKNAIPFDTEPPFRPSGIRLGTPALTTRGLTEQHMPILARWIDESIEARDNDTKLATLHAEVIEFMREFPLPNER
ncbi:MAG: serine hydroxymethyltransferase [Bifidobacteriaceae bacterium]|jgi:glycine hydroxymethyltransferase|nr:serine hydroxymethyltransferase [Bifidobacteriaceae bacterium]